MIHYVCKYTPVELFKGFGEDCAVLEEMPENFELSDKIARTDMHLITIIEHLFDRLLQKWHHVHP